MECLSGLSTSITLRWGCLLPVNGESRNTSSKELSLLILSGEGTSEDEQ